VNVQAGGLVAEDVRPALPLAEKLGRVFTALSGGLPLSLTVDVRGDLASHDVSVLELAAVKGVFTDIVEESVTFVNAPLLAKERGVEIGLTTESESPEYRSLVTVAGVLPDAREVSVSGTLSGPRPVQKLTSIDGLDVDLVPDGHLLFIRYTDRPGVVGTLGVLLGDGGVNIAGMQVARASSGGRSLMALAVDQAVPAELQQSLGSAIDAHSVIAVNLSDV
jgi:D-3-phosphoglycerate dehydrogenase